MNIETSVALSMKSDSSKLQELDFGERLKSMRVVRGIKRATLARSVGVTYGTVVNWETNSNRPTLIDAKRIADALDVTIYELVGIEPFTYPVPRLNDVSVINFGTRMKAIRMQRRLVRKELAVELGVSPATIVGWEIGRSYPILDSGIQLGHVLQVPLEYLLDTDEFRVKKTLAQVEANFGTRLKWLRHLNNLTQAELASALGVTSMLIWKWENERKNPTPEDIERVNQYFGLKNEDWAGVDMAPTINKRLKRKIIIDEMKSIGSPLEHWEAKAQGVVHEALSQLMKLAAEEIENMRLTVDLDGINPKLIEAVNQLTADELVMLQTYLRHLIAKNKTQELEG